MSRRSTALRGLGGLLCAAAAGCGAEGEAPRPAGAGVAAIGPGGGLDLLLDAESWTWRRRALHVADEATVAAQQRRAVRVFDEELPVGGWVQLTPALLERTGQSVEDGAALWIAGTRKKIDSRHGFAAAAVRDPGRTLRRREDAGARWRAGEYAVSASGVGVALPVGEVPGTGLRVDYPIAPVDLAATVVDLRRLQSGSPEVCAVTIGSDQRPALVLATRAIAERSLRLPEGAVLELALCVPSRLASSDGWLHRDPEPPNGLGLRVWFSTGDGPRQLCAEHEMAAGAVDRYVDVRVDLGARGGQTGALAFEVYALDAGAGVPSRGDLLFVAGARVASATAAVGGSALVLLLDTLRADALGCYGQELAISPWLDAFAASGVRFAQARSSSSWTLPAHASLFTAMHPSEHGVCVATDRLERGFTTLAEVLRAAGWRTAAFTDGGYVAPSFGLGQGFQRFDSGGGGVQGVLAEARAWIDAGTGPYFAFVQTYEVHDPYDPPEDLRRRWVEPYDGPLPERVHFLDLVRLLESGEASAADARYAHQLYLAEVAYTDGVVGSHLDALRAAPGADDLLLVVASDHGEEFLEHGGFGHRETLYEEQLWIPLLLHHPQHFASGAVVSEPVLLLDVAPTVLEVLGVAAPVEWSGISLTRPATPRALFWTLEHSIRPELTPCQSVIWGTQKWITAPDGFHQPWRATAGGDELYDLDTDPGERSDRWRAEHTDDWRSRLEAMLARFPDRRTGEGGGEATPSPAEVERLKGLGY